METGFRDKRPWAEGRIGVTLRGLVGVINYYDIRYDTASALHFHVRVHSREEASADPGASVTRPKLEGRFSVWRRPLVCSVHGRDV